jgi:lipopolysaccharide/colanic/teichoic acid biosynthesis glycosyltransferase
MSAREVQTRRAARWSLASVRSRVEAASAADRRIAVAKRALDLVISGALLALLLPFIVVLAILVRLDSPGPAFYRCERVGYRGRRLQMIKFRKMVCDAAGPPLTKADDQRFTRIGRSLARYKLDELPQLWHVFRGEMSLVGPRPESPEFVQRFAADYYGRILTVKPGIFGYSQIAFAEESRVLDVEDPMGHYLGRILPQKVGLDCMYAACPSVLKDIQVLFWACVTVVFRKPVAVQRASGAMTIRRRHIGGNDG